MSGDVLSAKPKMIRYHDLTVKFHSVGNTGSQGTGIFNYADPFANGASSGGVEYPTTITKIVYTSDATPSSLIGYVQDFGHAVRNIVMSNKGHNINNQSDLDALTVGCGITVAVTPDSSRNTSKAYTSTGDNTNSTIFKGYICSISKQFSSDGITYNFEARDIKYRLTYQTIKKVYNNNYKNGSTPIVKESSYNDNDGCVYTSGRLTVKEILKDIIDYSRKTSSYNNTQGYNFIGFDLSNFDQTDNYLMGFIPQTISFDNITIFEAIYKLINSAGPYRMVIDYSNDKIYFPRLDSMCRKCGNEIKLKYGQGSNSFDEVNVISDTTTRKIYDACSLMKSYSGYIDWYSGHFRIEKGDTSSHIKVNTTGDKDQSISCRNWDGYNYYFGIKSIPVGDDSDKQYIIVGAPLYPAWEPWEGYEPFSRKYDGFIDKNKNGKFVKSSSNNGGITLNYGITENDMRYIKHRNFIDSVGKDKMNNAAGLSYVAYVPYGKCETCNGTGAVEDISDYRAYKNVFGNTRDLKGRRIKSVSLSPFDFEFKDPKYTPVDNLEDYCGENYKVPSRHPVPWKNTCPVCRGTGMEPWFKMGTILNSLIDISPDHVKIGSKDVGSSIDANTGTRVDKTYSQIVEDMSYKYQAVVHIETNTSYFSYCFAAESNSSSFIPTPICDEDRRKHNEYKLQVKSLVGINVSNDNEDGGSINRRAVIFPDGNDGSKRARHNSSHYIHALYHTQIQEASGYSLDTDRSLVVFNNSQFISCSSPMASPLEEIYKDKDNKVTYKVVAYDDENKHFKYNVKGSMNGIGQYVGSFWRPARAWITCYFRRDRYESKLTSNHKTVTRTTNAGDSFDFDTYDVTARIEDNRYCAEIIKHSGAENVEEYHLRPIARSIFCDDFRWQLHPWDMTKYNIPSSGDSLNFIVPTDYKDLWNKIYKSNQRKNYYFPCGKIMKYEPLRDTELKSAINNNIDVAGSLAGDIYGKVISWIHKDDRIKLFEKACAEFERRNNVQISGSIKIKGEIPSFNQGFGFVKLQDNMKACVVKEELNFDGDFTIDLEVGTEELRVGQKKEKEMEYERLMHDTISGLNLKYTTNLAQSVTNQNRVNDNVTMLGAIRVGDGISC